jgi:hypothetical protein
MVCGYNPPSNLVGSTVGVRKLTIPFGRVFPAGSSKFRTWGGLSRVGTKKNRQGKGIVISILHPLQSQSSPCVPAITQLVFSSAHWFWQFVRKDMQVEAADGFLFKKQGGNKTVSDILTQGFVIQ